MYGQESDVCGTRGGRRAWGRGNNGRRWGLQQQEPPFPSPRPTYEARLNVGRGVVTCALPESDSHAQSVGEEETGRENFCFDTPFMFLPPLSPSLSSFFSSLQIKID